MRVTNVSDAAESWAGPINRESAIMGLLKSVQQVPVLVPAGGGNSRKQGAKQQQKVVKQQQQQQQQGGKKQPTAALLYGWGELTQLEQKDQPLKSTISYVLEKGNEAMEEFCAVHHRGPTGGGKLVKGAKTTPNWTHEMHPLTAKRVVLTEDGTKTSAAKGEVKGKITYCVASGKKLFHSFH